MMLTIEKTESVILPDENGTVVAISDLPDHIVREVQIYDQLRQDILEHTYELDKATMASNEKKSKINRELRKYIKKHGSKKVAEEKTP